MNTLLWTWFGVTAATMCVWLLRHRQLRVAARVMPPLHSAMYPDNGVPLPPISFLVAGKDEQANIGVCLESLAAQDYPDLQIIAINDRSTDRTAAIMNETAARHPRITALHVTQLRDGWFGKNNAMREGVSQATADWLCFTDADCEQISPRSLRIAMRYALEHKVDFLSVLPAHNTGSFWESVIQPACSGVMMIWFNPLRVNNPKTRTAYANGAFMLMKRSCYDAIGGHEVVKTELNEDMHMARLAKEAGQRLRVVSNVDLYTVRMYESFAQTLAGWSRIFYGCFGTRRRLLVTAVILIIFSLLPWFTLAASIAALATGGVWNGWRWLCAVAAASCLGQITVMLRFYGLNRLNPAYGLLYPLGAAIGLWTLIGAIRRIGGRAITWRGTTYRGTQVDAPTAAVAPK